MPAGRKRSLDVHENFIYIIDPNLKNERTKCKHCTEYNIAKSTSREAKHLEECLGYIVWMRGQDRPTKRQKTLNDTIARISSERKTQIDKDLAMCIFTTGKPLSLFNDDCWIQFFKNHFGYTLPSQSTISGPLLDLSYETTKNQLVSLLSASPSFGLVIDESTNISLNRIINTSIITSSGESFYWSNMEAVVGKIGAKELAEHTIQVTKEITHGDISKVASITTDTCSTLRSLWSLFENKPETKHIFTIPYNSHGLQLIIKDLLLLPAFNRIWSLASNIVNSFRNAPKQYGYLQQEQVLRLPLRWE
jgi:hypothetical protein